MPVEQVTTHYLRIHRDNFNELVVGTPEDVTLVEMEEPSVELAQFLFVSVGTPWRWFSRLNWHWEQWEAHLKQTSIRTWVVWYKGAVAGYFELNIPAWSNAEDQDVEVNFIGLLPQFTGKGLGKWLVSSAISLGFDSGASSVWLHTCSNDHPNALNNYLKCGFTLEKSEVVEESIPDLDSQAWSSPEFHRSRLLKFYPTC